MNMGLNNRVVLVTGSSSGIGRETAVAYGREGARVAITYHSDRYGAEKTAERVREVGGTPIITRYDLSDKASIFAAVQHVLDEWGTLHILVNNAVQWGARGNPTGMTRFEDVEPEQWQSMIRSTLEGAYQTIQASLPAMRDSRWGRIINISSSIADEGLPGAGAYAAGKAGVHGLTRTLSVELADAGILSNCVIPGMTLTERAKRVLPNNIREEIANQTPTKRLTTPEEVANLVLFLGSEANGHINGELIRVSGGL
ncbi:SDR family oxidoreductase [Gracilibacillus salitolerans]|uniref:SDR family oxidoreductase n=1 Tax=Gracilibacillus salitolerans TaxID=2663022 RepID=A0A5Q2TN57_9BACI|nr:SDR family NAD(P)-dependent oxidoreductase [Gracilibacillus salitolerans]QGH35507.1 SDR family oxidoreductase [Gracilibacillus salitolerans]